jgi:tripartite-type tricarboxylate transporter receptor subunit TctC
MFWGNAMKFSRRTFLTVAAATLTISTTVFGYRAWSQITPRTIKLVVPYPPGGTADIIGRLLGEQISRANGPTIVVENRPGGGTAIGSEAVARAAADGNTLLINSPEFVITPHLRRPNYEPLTGFEFVCHLVNSPTVIVVNSDSPYRKLSDLLDAARGKPAELSMASTGIFQVAIEMLKRRANANLTYVPFAGNAPASNALLGGHVTSVFAVYPTVSELLKSGKLRALATASRKRIDTLPNVPTVIESGFNDYEVDVWLGLVAPAKTPTAILSQIATWFTSALAAPAIKSKLVEQESYAVGVCGPDFGAYIRRQYEEVGRTIREANIKAE